MRIGDVIGPDQVVVGLRVADKAQLLQELARRAGAALGIDRRIILDALQARENLGSTGLGKGFALPHARLDAVARPFACSPGWHGRSISRRSTKSRSIW